MTEEIHPLPPFLPAHATLLMLGSFPPPKNRWKMDFYYPNFNNDMWRIFGLVFFNDKNYFIDSASKILKEQNIRAFLLEKGIAIYDVAYRVRRLQGNASDKYLQIIEPIHLDNILSHITRCDDLITTGELATATLLSMLPPETGRPSIGRCVHTYYAGRLLQLHRLPSSSRAYPLALEQKAAAYARCFQHIGLL